ncbi:hypothetical protein [Streptomyces sp. NK15101]|uniref:hypothetical protein n=1 Tax=Streptomyces sp. NK15101 TaxID=2873261 RepID=UPI001CEC16D4|nr:hypothetical protein [Streptomyces sp. NK15101]
MPAEEVQLLRQATVDGMITTVYDTPLSQGFTGLRPYVGRDQPLFSDAQGIAGIHSVHGSAAGPESPVLTAEDRRRFEERNACLAAKSLTIFVEHAVVSLCHDLSDRNVHSILSAITPPLTGDNIDHVANRPIIGEGDSTTDDPHAGPPTPVFDQTLVPIALVRASDFRPVFRAPAGLRGAFGVGRLQNGDITGLHPSAYRAGRFRRLGPVPRTRRELDAHGPVEPVAFSALLDADGYDLEEPRQVPVERMGGCGPGTSHATSFHRCVCPYDLPACGPAARAGGDGR